MTITRKDTALEIRASVSGSARIDDAEVIAHEFRSLLKTTAPVVSLDVRGLADADVSFFQLLGAFGKSLSKSHRRLHIKKLPEGHLFLDTAALLGIDLEHLVPTDEASL
jgi:hypothetical protein